MKIAFLGSRGIPARYSGFETFYEQLGARLAARGHDVTVYNRRHFIKDVRGHYRGMRLVSLPSIRTKHLETLSHTFLSTLHALTQGYDIVYYCIVGNSPLVWLPRLAGARVLLNVDGQDWAREKWGRFARAYQRGCERLAVHSAQALIADAKVIQRRYAELYRAATIFAPYGANVARDEGTEALEKWGVKPRQYLFYVGRFVPENCIGLLIRTFLRLRTDMKLVLVGDAPYADAYKKTLQKIADQRVVFTGYAFGRDYAQLSSHAYAAIQPSAVDGTRPALLDQLGFGNCVLVRNSPANSEVVADCGAYFDAQDPEADLPAKLQQLVDQPAAVEAFRARAASRIEKYYHWDWIAAFYENLFVRLKQGSPLVSYDDYLQSAARTTGLPCSKQGFAEP